MNIKIKVEPAKKDHYKDTFKTYKDELTGTFERSELRYIIQKLDNAII